MARQKKLRPAGHSAFIEALIQPAIVLCSTFMSGIAAYVLAGEYVKRLLSGTGNGFDIFMVVLSGGIGFLIDMAIIVSATRYKMHKLRGPGDAVWMRLSLRVLSLCLVSEALTSLYFFYLQTPGLFPVWMAGALELIHSALVFLRALLPPAILAYFVAGVMPIVIERSDRNREVKSRTSQNIAVLVDRLTEVTDTQDNEAMLKSLGALLALNAYASNDTYDQLSEEEQGQRDASLLEKIASLHDIGWKPSAKPMAFDVDEVPLLPLSSVHADAS